MPEDDPPVASDSGGRKGGKRGKNGKKGGKASGACFKCGGEGHMARNCPEAQDGERADRNQTSETKGNKKGGKKGQKGARKGKKGGDAPPAAADSDDDDEDTADSRGVGANLPRAPKREAAPRRVAPSGEHTELAQGAIEALTSGAYECLICFSGIKTRQATWSCGKCYKIFHLSCTKQWGRSGTGGFRCPQCSEEHKHAPRQYLCFCGKVRDPQDDGYSTPHSCGDTCNKSRGVGCRHPCKEQCHPGPCPPCSEKAPLKSCHCGTEKYQLRCGEADPGRSCGKRCDKPLNCGQHTCALPCHLGECTPCEERYPQRCQCGKVVEEERLCDGAEITIVDGVAATFRCFDKCGKMKDCGKHKCTLGCHSGECPPCALTPELVDTCCCGKMPMSILTKKVRTSCTDTIPCCQAQCGKNESCEKHGCQLKCHEGECGPCKAQVTVQCGCKSSTLRVVCHKVPKEEDGPRATTEDDGDRPKVVWPPKCTRRCGAAKTCGRHKCNDVCCKSTTHQCTDLCRRKLDCGNHNCEERCHVGACAPCRHIVVEELACYCGAETLDPPQPCGTEPPACDRRCSRVPACGHDPAFHKCHHGDCPLCATRMEKRCAGDHSTVVVPCHVQNPTCPSECGKTLACKRHVCRKKCHAGTCPVKTEGTASCGGTCLEKLPCEHPCQKTCHEAKAGHTQQCTMKVKIKCTCGRKVEETLCHKFYAQMKALSGKKGGMGMITPTVPCDDSCKHEVRLDSMREALGIDKGRDSQTAFQQVGSLTPLTSWVFSHEAAIMMQKSPAHVKVVERSFQDLINGYTNTLMLPPMNDEKRRIVHELGAHYFINVISLDKENKSCQLTRTPHTKRPVPLLSEWMADPLELAQV